MSERFAISQQTPRRVLADELASPRLVLSSSQAGWEGLIVNSYHEPMEVEKIIAPTISDIALVLVMSGVMHMEQRDVNGPWEELHIRAGDLFLTPGGRAPSELRWRSLSSDPIQTLHLHLNTGLVSQVADQVVNQYLTHFAVVKRSGFQDPLLTQLGLALWRELKQHTPMGKLYVETAAQMLAVHLLRSYTSVEIALKEYPQGLTRSQVSRIADFIHVHLRHDLSLPVLAEQVGFSPYHFTRVFRQATGESPHQYVLSKRVERAQWLLTETDTPLAHVAIEAGFTNQSSFTQVFKQRLGLTPGAYRQKYPHKRTF